MAQSRRKTKDLSYPGKKPPVEIPDDETIDIPMEFEELPDKPAEEPAAKPVKYVVAVRAVATRINVPGQGPQKFHKGHVFEDPWPELIDLARADTGRVTLALIEKE